MALLSRYISRYIMPIWTALIFGVCTLNPLKLTWDQRISLMIVISVVAYFLVTDELRAK